MNTKDQKKIIGRLERVDFPEWELFDVVAKVDTGAYSSSLHCHHIELYKKGWVRFNLLDPEHEAYNEKLMELPVSDIREVKSSNGQVESRIFVETSISIAGENFDIELSLTNRSEMKYPILLGRKFLSKKFIVDVSHTYLSDKL